MRITLTVLSLGFAVSLQAAEPPLELTLARRGVPSITFEPTTYQDGTARIALADLTRGRPKVERLPPDTELEIRTATLGPWMSVNLGLYRTTAQSERRLTKEGIALSMPVSERRSTHRSIELRPGESAQVPLDGFVLTVKRPDGR